MSRESASASRARRGRLVAACSGQRVALWLLVLLSAWSVIYELAFTVFPTLLGTVVYRGIAPDIVFLIAAALLIWRGLRDERGWLLIGVGALCWAAGDIYWTLVLGNLANPPVPSLADAGYLSFCPLAFVGILSLVRQRMSTVPKALAADAGAAMFAAGAVGAALVLQPVFANADGGTLAVATNLAYPICDLFLLGLIVGATALGNWRLNRTWVLLAAAVLSFLVADSVYVVADATGTYTQGDWYNALWYWSPVIAGWAAWIPRAQRVSIRTRTGARGIVMPVAFASVAIAILVWSSFDRVGVVAIILATSSLAVVMARLVLTWRDNARLLRASQNEALADALTGLGNRRALLADLERRLSTAREDVPFTLVLFDLDGFKQYNDSFGHPSGDALLRRLGGKLEAHLGAGGRVYRIGGDEFCALINAPRGAWEAEVQAAALALSEQGEGFAIECSHGSVLLPSEAQDSSTALTIADQRMYADKRAGRATAAQQCKDVLVSAVAERNPELGAHGHDVAELAGGRGNGVLAAARRDRGDPSGGRAPRRRQGGDPGCDPPETGCARRERVGVHAAPYPDRRADHCHRAGSRARGPVGPLEPRELRRERVPGRARAQGDTARRADHRGLRRLRRDDHRPSLPRRHGRARRGCRAAPVRRDSVRPARRR